MANNQIKIQKMERALDKFLDLCYKLNQAATDLQDACYPLGWSLPRAVNEELKDANFVLSQVQETINFLHRKQFKPLAEKESERPV